MPELPTAYTISPSNDSTLAIEITTIRFRRPYKHTLFFNEYSGKMSFAEKDLKSFEMALTIDATSVECRDPRSSEKKRQAVGDFARKNALEASMHPQIRFTSNSISAKALRGFVVEGMLQIRDSARVLKVNVVFNTMRKDSIQLDGDATLRLSDFGLPARSAMFGLIRTKDEVVVRLLLWAIPKPSLSDPQPLVQKEFL